MRPWRNYLEQTEICQPDSFQHLSITKMEGFTFWSSFLSSMHQTASQYWCTHDFNCATPQKPEDCMFWCHTHYYSNSIFITRVQKGNGTRERHLILITLPQTERTLTDWKWWYWGLSSSRLAPGRTWREPHLLPHCPRICFDIAYLHLASNFH